MNYDELEDFICSKMADEEAERQREEEYYQALQEDYMDYLQGRELGLC